MRRMLYDAGFPTTLRAIRAQASIVAILAMALMAWTCAGVTGLHGPETISGASGRAPVDGGELVAAEQSLQGNAGPGADPLASCGIARIVAMSTCSGDGTQNDGFQTPTANTTSNNSPPSRYGGSMTYDARDGYVLLFGGGGVTQGFLRDTWKYAKGTWTKLREVTSPPARAYGVMAYDAHDGYVVLFGGQGRNLSYLGDTWKFVGGSWSQLATSPSPSPRDLSEMSYDSADGYVVLFGGYGTIKKHPALGDTWKFSAGNWTNITPATSPSPRYWATMTDDQKDGYVVLFGGDTSPGISVKDTWEFAGDAWTNLNLSHSPSARMAAAATYDAKDGYVVLFGGATLTKQFNDTWKFFHGRWTNITSTPSPSVRYASGMGFDAKLGYVVLFGGTGNHTVYGDTWKYLGGVWSLN